MPRARAGNRKASPSRTTKRRTGGEGFIFEARNGKPLRLENLLRRDMRPALDEQRLNGMAGTHSGAALRPISHAGVKAKDIQAILRHANVSTTMAYYVRPVAAEFCGRHAENGNGLLPNRASAERKRHRGIGII